MYLTAPFLSSLLHAKVWPVLEPVVCELMRSSIEPLLDDLKPPFIAAMERAQCTTHCPYACQASGAGYSWLQPMAADICNKQTAPHRIFCMPSAWAAQRHCTVMIIISSSMAYICSSHQRYNPCLTLIAPFSACRAFKNSHWASCQLSWRVSGWWNRGLVKG
jgi:hypothetical protein